MKINNITSERGQRLTGA